MKALKFNSQVSTTRVQSEQLLALGLKKETADMGIVKSTNEIYVGCPTDYSFENGLHIPAWSLHRLLLLLPTEYSYDIDFQRIMQDFVFGSQDMYDEVISCIKVLIEEGYFYNEYLEE